MQKVGCGTFLKDSKILSLISNVKIWEEPQATKCFVFQNIQEYREKDREREKGVLSLKLILLLLLLLNYFAPVAKTNLISCILISYFTQYLVYDWKWSYFVLTSKKKERIRMRNGTLTLSISAICAIFSDRIVLFHNKCQSLIFAVDDIAVTLFFIIIFFRIFNEFPSFSFISFLFFVVWI